MKSKAIEETNGKFGPVAIRALAVGAQSIGAIAAGALAIGAVTLWGSRDWPTGGWPRENQASRNRRAKSNAVACDRLNDHAAIGTPAVTQTILSARQNFTS